METRQGNSVAGYNGGGFHDLSADLLCQFSSQNCTGRTTDIVCLNRRLIYASYISTRDNGGCQIEYWLCDLTMNYHRNCLDRHCLLQAPGLRRMALSISDRNRVGVPFTEHFALDSFKHLSLTLLTKDLQKKEKNLIREFFCIDQFTF